MKPILINVNGTTATVMRRVALTTGLVGQPVVFNFDEAWAGLSRAAIFKSGVSCYTQLNIDDTATIPHELLRRPDRQIQVGVYGFDADGNVAIPTIWETLGTIQPGAYPNGQESTDPALPIWAQLEGRMEALENVGPAYYTSLCNAAADLNAYTTVNADAEEGSAACSLYTDSDGLMHLTLLANLDLAETITFTAPVHFNMNGHTITYLGEYSIKFQAESASYCSNGNINMHVESIGSVLDVMQIQAGAIIGINFNIEVDDIPNYKELHIIGAQTGKVTVEDSILFIKVSGGGAVAGSYAVYSSSSAELTLKNTSIEMEFTGKPLASGVQISATAGRSILDHCQIHITGDNSSPTGIGVNTPATIDIYDTTIEVVGKQKSASGVRVNSGNAFLSNTSAYVTTNNLQGSGGVGMEFINSTVKLLNSSCIANSHLDAASAKGIRFSDSIAYVIDCYSNSGHTGIGITGDSKVYISGGTIGGYSHGLYCTHAPGGEVFVNDATLLCAHNKDIPLCAENEGYSTCSYIGLEENTGQTVYFDGCTFTSGKESSALDYAVVLRSNKDTPTTANLSNCTIKLTSPKPFRIEDGANNDKLSAVNIGINTVDHAGNFITRDHVKDEDVDSDVADSNPEHLHVTGLLYRRLPENATVTGKDYKAYCDYLEHFLTANQ